jgi:O-antigen/teichoic acid export membrane protein
LRKTFIINLFFIVALNLLIKPFWFIEIETSVQNHVGNAEYGIYFSLFNLSFLFSIILDLGINNFNNREIAKNKNLLSRYFSNILGIKILLAILYLSVTFIAGLVLGYPARYFHILSFLALNQMLSFFILYLRSNINGLLLFIRDSILSVMDKFLMILICSYLLWFSPFKNSFTIEYFIYAQTISYIITIIVAWFMIISKVENFKLNFQVSYFLFFIKKGIPFSILVLLMHLYSRMEPIMLERLLPNGKFYAGLYAQAYRMIDLFLNFLTLFTVLLLPIFSNQLSTKKDVRPMVILGAKMMFIPTIIIVALCSIYSNEIINILYHNELSAPILRIVILGFSGYALVLLFGTLLTANNNLKQLNIISFLSIVLNITLNLIFIPKYQAVGAAWSSFVTQIACGTAQALFALYLFKFKFSNSALGIFIIWIVFVFGCGIILKHYLPFIPGISILICISLISALLMKIVDLREIKQIFIAESAEAKI